MRFSRLLAAAGAAATLAFLPAAAQEAPPAAKESEAERPRLADIDLVLDEAEAEETAGQAIDDAQALDPSAEAEPAAPTAPPLPTGPLTAEERAALAVSVERGRILAAVAQAGLLGTQDMLTRISDPDAAGIEGWLVEPEGNGFAVTFYGAGGPGPVAVYRSRVLGGRVVSRDLYPQDARPVLSPALARMAAARAAAGALDHAPCGAEAFNTLVVPPEGPSAPIRVYQITPAADRGHVPVGGHFRATIGADGEVAETRGFAACQNVALPEPGTDGRPRPIPVAHLLDRVPTEVHVFLSLWTGRPLVVATGDGQSQEAARFWLVTGEGIAELRR